MNSVPEKQEIFSGIVSLLARSLDLDGEENLAHGLRVATLCQAIGKQLNHGNPSQLYIAGLLHDIGGMSLENHLRHFTQDDLLDIDVRNHSIRGAEILYCFPPFHHLVGWVADHHERFDGTGFPTGKSRYDITSEAGILHIANLLDLFFRNHPEASLKDIRKFLNQQSATSVAPVVVEGAKHLFRSVEILNVLKEHAPDEYCFSIRELSCPEINSMSVPELLCQLLWLTAQVADCKLTANSYHSKGIAFYCHSIAKAFHSPDIDPQQALWAGLLHDIGIRANSVEELKHNPAILAKTSELYRQHPILSANLVSSVKVLEHFAPILAAHHEYWDGTGFPNGLTGEEIPMLSQIISLCEHYDMLREGAPNGHPKNRHQHAIKELEKGRDQLFSSLLLDIALPILQIWGPRDISWMRDIKNVHAFFTSDPFDTIIQKPHEQVTAKQPEESDSNFTPRQWQVAELDPDFTIKTGRDALREITAIGNIENFFDIIETPAINKTEQALIALQNTASFTITLSTRNGTPLELIFLKQKDSYHLLYRGINETPLFCRKHSIFYQSFRNTPEAELIISKEAVIQDINDSARLLLGFQRQSLLGKNIEILFSPFLSESQRNSLHTLMVQEQKDIWIEDFALVNHRGISFSIQVTIVPLSGQNAQDLAYLCRLRDISLRKELEQEMLQRDRAMQLIVHNFSGITGEPFFKSLLLQFASVSESSLVMVAELIDEDMAIQPIAFRENNSFVPKEMSRLENTPDNMILLKGEVYFPMGLQELFPLDISLQKFGVHSYWGLPLRGQDGIIIGILVAMDCTTVRRSKSDRSLVNVLQSLAGSELARMQTERTLQENKSRLESQNRKLTRMNQFKSDMIAVTSHDLKSPLSAILGYTNLLEQYFSTLEEDKKIYYIKRIGEAGQKQLTFINKLLDLYHIESGQLSLELSHERLDTLVSDCIDAQELTAAKQNISIVLRITGTPTPILLDRLRMEQVISSILSNGIKFSPSDTTIEVYCNQDEQNGMVQICDCGKGINEEEILHIFDRYYMGRTNFDIRPEGSGLGLYIVKNIITLHDGKVSARNRTQGGSCFTVQIPVKTTEKP